MPIPVPDAVKNTLIGIRSCIFFSKLLIDIFLVKTLKFELEGSKAIVVEFGFFKEL